jgi:hypothetical protein
MATRDAWRDGTLFRLSGKGGVPPNSGTQFYTYTFGPEVPARALGVKPFAHALFGGGRFSGGGVNSTGFTTYLGGGVDVKILPFVSARLAQVDWMTTRFSGVTDKNNLPVWCCGSSSNN